MKRQRYQILWKKDCGYGVAATVLATSSHEAKKIWVSRVSRARWLDTKGIGKRVKVVAYSKTHVRKGPFGF